jgi:hypothetical protein
MPEGRMILIMKMIALLTLATMTVTAAASAQTATPRRDATDAEKVADALRAGPTFITKDAAILDWPSTPDGDYRVLRKGTSEWTCLPGAPGYPHDEPGCFDRVFMQWIKDGLAGRAAHIDRIGIAYMYVGAWVPHQAAPTESPDKYFHVGPHIMVVSPNQDELQAFTRDGASGMPYINHLPKRTEVFVVIPIREWDEKPR